MTEKEHKALSALLHDPWSVTRNLKAFLASAEITEEPKGNRTPKQNRAVWLYITQRVNKLNDAGLDQRTVLKPSVSIPWTKEAFHDLVWCAVQKAMYGTESMRDLKKDQCDPIHAVIERELSEKHGVEQIPFPHGEVRSDLLDGMELAGSMEYPEYKEPKF